MTMRERFRDVLSVARAVVLVSLALVTGVPPARGQTLGFYTVSPCRVVDTRSGNGPWGGPVLGAGTERTFTIGGRCGVPTSATAVSLNLTVVTPTAHGNLRVFAAGTSLPGTSAISYSPGRTRANNASVGLGAGAGLTVRVDQASGTVHLVMDVNGYYYAQAPPPPPPPPPPPSGGGAHLWSRDFGGVSSMDNAVPLDVAVDGAGDVVVVGYLQNAVDLGTGPLRSAGYGDLFVAKYSGSNGAALWVRQAGSTMEDRAKGVAIDASGNIVVAGAFQGTIDLGGGPLSTPPTGTNAFLVKYSPGGTHIWSKRLNSLGGMDEATGVGLDGQGNILVAGVLYQTSNFGGASMTTMGGADAFVAKFTSSGAHVWSRRAGGSADETVNGLAVDPGGSAILTGVFLASADFGGGPLGNAGRKDGFVAKYAGGDGAHVWSKGFGGSLDEVGQSVAADGSGNVVLTGTFQSSVNFGGGALTNAAGADIFLVKWNSGGGHLWSRQFSGQSGIALGETSYAVSTDTAGNVLLTGTVVDRIDFGGGALLGDGYYDIFAAKFDAGATHVWSKRTGAGEGRAVTAGPDGSVTLTGTFSGSTTVNFGGQNLASPGGTDMFLVRFGP